MKDRRPSHSIKELMNNEETAEESYENWPRQDVHTPKFSCPLSNNIMWYRGLMYASCPVSENNRDMPACNKCIHKGAKAPKKEKREKMPIVEIKKKEKTAIPKIGKTYHSK